MEFRIAATLSILRLYNGRLSLYASLTVGRRHWFVSRWDSVRVLPQPGTRELWRGPEMTWYAGRF